LTKRDKRGSVDDVMPHLSEDEHIAWCREQLGLRPVNAKSRKCLICDKMFDSSCPGHRYCNECRYNLERGQLNNVDDD